jgi:hypothetical protein
MGFLDSVVGRAFRDEKAGRVVVFSGDRRNRGYLVKSEAEELRIRAFLKMFYIAHFSIFLLGLLLANAWSMFFTHLEGFGRPAEHVPRVMGISLGIYSLVVGLPYFLLWSAYKKSLLSFVSPQDEVLVSGKSLGQQRWTVLAAMTGFGILILMAVIFLLVRGK